MSDEQQTSHPAGDLAARWLGFEQIFSQDGYDGGHAPWPSTITDSVSQPTPGLLEVTGSRRPHIVVTAPHATNHERDGAGKVADRGTGGLAILLAQLTGCTALVALDTPGDANYDDEHPLKERLADLRPTTVIDLHGMRSREESDVDLGTGTGPVPSLVVTALNDSDLRVTTNQVFDAMRPTTVTSFAQARGIYAVQVEIGAHLRPPTGDAEATERLVRCLVDAVGSAGSQGTHVLTPTLVALRSGLPTVVVHPSLLTGTSGPVPLTVMRGDQAVVAWAWSASAPGMPDAGAAVGPDQIGTAKRLATDLGAPDVASMGPVTTFVPEVARLRLEPAIADDMPAPDEVQVCPQDFSGSTATHLLVRNGVTAWVTTVPRKHVRPGSIRLGYQLRLLTERDGDASTALDARHAALVAAPRDVVALRRDRSRSAGRRAVDRFRRTADHVTEQVLRAIFRAPTFSARIIQAHAGDDGTSLVAMHPAVFDRIGVESGQQVLVRWGGREAVALAVADHDPPAGAPLEPMKLVQRVNYLSPNLPEGLSPHVVMRLSARLRGDLGAPSATVVTVRRRLRPVLVRNLNGLVVPLASLVLAGAALEDPHWPLLGLGTGLMSVLALARLRIPQPRSGARVDEDWVDQMAEPVGATGPETRRGGERLGG